MMRNSTLLLFLATLVTLFCCDEGTTDKQANVEQLPRIASQVSDATSDINFPSFELIGEIDGIFQRPESIVYDSTTGLLYVSNVGKDADDSSETDGYISKLNLHGQIIDQRWVEGLSDPRGMCINGNILLVADINRIVKIDIKSGKVKGTISVPNLKQLSDLEKDTDGVVYATDTKSNSIYTLRDGLLKLWKEDNTFDGPTGLYHSGDQLLVTSAGGSKLMAIDIKSGKTHQIADSLQQARGITMIGQDLIVGGLSGQLYGVKASVDFRWPLIDLQMQQDNFADILYIEEYNVMFVPTFRGNSVLAISVLN
ncbi:MAG: hypothetical protein WBA74_09060 [Cyclobacteriaceae bacterium]